MAGEWSKKIGEDGERIALKLMDIIGWPDIQKGLDIPCIDNAAHERSKAHGLDGLFSYRSPLHDRLLRHVCVSVKYHAKGYPSGVKSKFKKHIKALDHTIECFKKSELHGETNQLWTSSGIDKADTVGLLVWLHGDRTPNSDSNLIDKFKDTRIPSDIELRHPILLIDHHRVQFIFDTYYYATDTYPNHKISINYQRTGNNNADNERNSDGPKYPWEMLSSGLLVYRAVTVVPDERILIIASIDTFSADSFKSILGFAHHLSNNLANRIDICFPDYIQLENENQVNAIKASFDDVDFTRGVRVVPSKRDYRN